MVLLLIQDEPKEESWKLFLTSFLSSTKYQTYGAIPCVITLCTELESVASGLPASWHLEVGLGFWCGDSQVTNGYICGLIGYNEIRGQENQFGTLEHLFLVACNFISEWQKYLIKVLQ